MRLGKFSSSFRISMEARPGTPWRTVLEAVGIKPKVQQRPQEVRDTRNMKYLLREFTNIEQRQPERERLHRLQPARAWGGAAQAPGMHIAPQCVLDAGCGDAKLNVCPTKFQPSSHPIFSIPLFLSFRVRMSILCHCTSGICGLLLILQDFTAKSLFCVSYRL